MSIRLKPSVLIAVLNGISLISTLIVQLLFAGEVESSSFSDNVFLISSLGMFVISVFSSTLGVYLIENFSKIQDCELYAHISQIYKSLWRYLFFSVVLMLLFCFYLVYSTGISFMVLGVHVLSPILIFHSSIITSVMYSRGKILLVEIVNFVGAIVPLVIMAFCTMYLNDTLLSIMLVLKVFISFLIFQTLYLNKKYFVSKELNLLFINSIRVEAKKVLKTSMLFKSEGFIDKFIVSFMPEGGLTLFHLLTSIANGVMSIYSKIVTIPLSYSIAIDQKDCELKLQTAIKTWRIMMYSLSIIALLFFLLLSQTNIIENRFANNYGFVLSDNILMLVSLLFAYSYMAKNQIYSVFLYSKGLPLEAIKVGMSSFFINITQKVMLFFFFSFTGFYFAYALGQFITLILYKKRVDSSV